jgi:hypothetical protein
MPDQYTPGQRHARQFHIPIVCSGEESLSITSQTQRTNAIGMPLVGLEHLSIHVEQPDELVGRSYDQSIDSARQISGSTITL